MVVSTVFVFPSYFILPFVISLVFFLVFTRIIHAVFSLFFRDGSLKDSTRAELVIGSTLQFFVHVVSQLFVCLLRFLGYMSSILLWFFVLVMFLSFFYVIYEEYPSVLIESFRFYNTRIGPFMHTYLVVPIELLNMFYKGTVPLWNAFWWFGKVWFNKGVLPVILQELHAVTRFGVVFVTFIKSVAVSFRGFLWKLDCEDRHCIATNVDDTMDVLTPMQHVRDLAVIGISFWRNVCNPLQIPIQLVVYPLLDSYFASSLHHFLNTITQFFLQIPIATYYRCLVKGGKDRLLMCTPDFEPFWVHLLTGLKHLGLVLDHWIRYGMWVMQEGIQDADKVVTGTCADLVTVHSDTVAGGILSGSMVMVSLHSYWNSVSNGSMVMFDKTVDHVLSETVFKAWPMKIDPTFGVANVRFSSSGTTKDALMGCNCTDVSGGGLVVRCGFVSLTEAVRDETSMMDVLFQDKTWSSAFTCGTVEISVKSVRFPVRRYDNSPSDTNCIVRGNCENVDATVWLVPKCGSLPSAACNPQAIGTNCYPFCMATRVSGTMNAQIVFTNAQTWRTGRQILFQNCMGPVGKGSQTSTSVSSSSQSFTYQMSDNALSASSGDSKFGVYAQGNSNYCQRGVNTVSFLTNQTQTTPYIRSAGQPFAITGETILVFSSSPDGRGVVHVERLTGNQQDVYFLAKTPFDIPTAPRLNLPVSEFQYNPVQHLYVPLEFQARRIYATSSDRYVFYAQSPNLELFGAYFEYCRDKDSLPKFQYMLFSSYSPLRVYRVRAYCSENCIGIVSSQTFVGFSDENINDRDFFCSRKFNASFQGIEYVDQYNIAVTVQEADSSYNAYSDSGLTSKYRVYWLHPETMLLRSPEQGKWLSGNTLGNQELLGCVDITPPPPMGTFLALVIALPLHFVRFATNGVLYSPGVIQQWRQIGSLCPVETMGHSMIENCASSMYLLDDYFDALEQAGSIAWSSVMYLSTLLGDAPEPTPIQRVLQGLSYYGQATTSFEQLQGGISGLLNTPIVKELQGIWMVIRTQNVASGVGSTVAAASAWARFGYIAFNRMGVSMVKSILVSNVMDAKTFWTIFANGIYELQGEFHSIVGERSRSGCTGLRIIFGGDNPWANLVYHICLSNEELTEALIKMFATMFVEVPLVKCACVDASQFEPVSYMLSNCIPAAPPSLQTVLIHLMQRHSQETCNLAVNTLSTSMNGLVTKWLAELYLALDALGESIDYALIGFDASAGQCTDYQTNPNVVVIIPEPVDYFQACGTTQSCKTKCSGTWDYFQSALQEYSPDSLVGSITIANTVESKFFPYPVEEIVSLGTVVALTQMHPCTDVCVDSTDQCLAVAFLQESSGDILVRYFCVPDNPVAPVKFSTTGSIHWDVSHGELVQLKPDTPEISVQKGYFLKEDGSSLVVFVMGGQVGRLVQLDKLVDKSTRVRYLFDTSDLGSGVLAPLTWKGMRSMQLIDFLVMRDRVLVSLGVRVIVNGQFQAQKACLFLDSSTSPPTSVSCAISDDLWRGYSPSEFRQYDMMMSVMLLWPISMTVVPRVIRFKWDELNNVQILNVQNLDSEQTLISRVSILPKSLFLSKFAMDDAVTSLWVIYACDKTTMYDWLKQLRIMYTGNAGNVSVLSTASLYNSQTIKSSITVQTGCDGLDCRGCPSLQLRSLCTAYQSCAVFQCVGTPINLNRPLCGMGLYLKSLGSLTIQSTQGAYTIFVQMFMIIVKLSSKANGATGALSEIAFPDESFFGYVCTAKDKSAELISVVTSSLNSVIQLSQTGGPILQRAAAIDPSAHIALSFSVTALTSFFHQIMLYPIYTMTIARTIMLCKIQGFIALFTVSKTAGYKVNVMSPRFANATDSMVGHCLTQAMMTQTLQTSDTRVRGLLANSGGEFLANAAQIAVRTQIEPMMHMLDGWLCYVAGILYKFGDVLRGLNLKSCLLPNVLVSKVVQCACGDQPMMISGERAVETAQAHWCTGTLFITKPDGSSQVVYNPYSFDELRRKTTLAAYQKYFKCLESSLDCIAPNNVVFSQQGFNLIQIMTKCRYNFVRQQWDAGAFVLYDEKLISQKLMMVPRPSALPVDEVGQCLLLAASQGRTNQDCLNRYMSKTQQNNAYWNYETLSDSENTLLVDGCVVFSGPAAKDVQFQPCLQSYANSLGVACHIDSHLWSPSSNNNVPVAFSHVLSMNETKKEQQKWVEEQFQAAHDLVVPLLDALKNFKDDTLNVGFFSAEGDLIHQILDCMYLGPYARVDYWPQMDCRGLSKEKCLEGFFWARDEDRGKVRGVDPKTCAKTGTLPFTCGSPSRKALVKYFVNIVILNGRKGSDVMNQFIRQWIAELYQHWRLSTTYDVDVDPATYLPRELNGDQYMYLNTSNVLTRLEFQLEILWNRSVFWNDPWTMFLGDVAEDEAKAYDWAVKDPVSIQDQARYGTTSPSMLYNKEEAMNPATQAKDTSLWEHCHGALKQVLFTMPVVPNASTLYSDQESLPLFTGGGPEKIQEHIQKITQQAFQHSPLFRHYHPKHQPSQSTVCLDESTVPVMKTAGVSVVFSDFTIQQENVYSGSKVIYSGSEIKPIPYLGSKYGLLGQTQHCFCGWDMTVDKQCQAPVRACADMSGQGFPCMFSVFSQNLSWLEAAYVPVWPCPVLELSEHFGFLDRDGSETWLLDQTNADIHTSMDALLRHGPGGLRVGNLERTSASSGGGDDDAELRSSASSLSQTWEENVYPSNRTVDATLGIVYGCETQAPLVNLLDSFVEKLFPMAQGIGEGGVHAYCLRYAMEWSRSVALQMLVDSFPDIDTTHQLVLDLVEQNGVTEVWKRRCGTQVQLISMCQSMNMFQMNALLVKKCPWPWVLTGDENKYGQSYITPQCLVSYYNIFYDPCICNSGLCVSSDSSIPISVQWLQSSCQHSVFDPRNIVTVQEFGWWEESSPLAKESNDWLSDFSNLLHWDAFVESVLDKSDLSTNTPSGEHWSTVEGLMQDTSMFCDLISDYWPEEALFPVGFHVTTPCMQEDIGYRSFDNVFALDEDTDPTQAVFRYMEDQTRDMDLIDSNFGAGGLCRKTNFGWDMYETNTMRLCTRTKGDESVDVHVPWMSTAQNVGLNSDFQCSASSKDIPWSKGHEYDYYDSTLYSIGTVPNLPWSGVPSTSYPTTGRYFIPGNVETVQAEDWGLSCEDFHIPYCNSSIDCPSGYKCMRGACLSTQVDCIAHSDCSGNQMCAGVGKCVDPVLSVWNDMNETSELRPHAADCGADPSYSMLGSSFWAYVPDFLQAHGMCSYRHWREYLHTLEASGGCTCTSNPADQGKSCIMQADTCTFYNYMLENNPVRWWTQNTESPSRLKMMPTTCDRDYERMQFQGKELKTCYPSSAQKVTYVQASGKMSNNMQQGKYVRTYNVQNKQVSVRYMPFRGNTTYGFLGNVPDIRSCGSVTQCYADLFYVNGVLSMKTSSDGILSPLRKLANGAFYDGGDIFRCGFMGYYDGTTCRIDRKLFPLYQILCKETPFPMSCENAVDTLALSGICSKISDEYSPSWKFVNDVNKKALVDLFQVFVSPRTLTQHVAVTQCVTYIYTQMNVPGNYYSQNLYFPFVFSVYEFPVSWMYQCMIGSGIFPRESDDNNLYSCPFFTDRFQDPAGYTTLSSVDSFKIYTSRIAGGYTTTSVATYLQTQRDLVKQRWIQSVQNVRTKYFPLKKPVSYCHTQRDWKLDGADIYTKALIYVKTRNMCQDPDYVQALIDLYNVNHPSDKILSLEDEDVKLTTLKNQQEQINGVDDLLREIQEWGLQYIDAQTGDIEVNSQTGDMDKYVQKIEMSLQPKNPVKYSMEMPGPTDDPVRFGLLGARILGNTNYYPYAKPQVTSTMPTNCPSAVLLFPQSSDPILKKATVCPVYQIGYFNCEFPSFTDADNKIVGFGYQDTAQAKNIAEYFTKMYTLIYNQFQTLTRSAGGIPSLAPSPLNFFATEPGIAGDKPFQFDLTKVKQYQNNINPDTSVPYMCVLGKNNTDYTQCTNPHYIALQDHVNKNYIQSGPMLVPAYQQVDWKNGKEMFLSGALYSFASTNRKHDRQHLMAWLDNQTVCNGNNVKINDRMCQFSDGGGSTALRTFTPISPWSLGDWNPGERCDVQKTDILSGYQEVIDIYCYYKDVCPFSANNQPDFTKDYYQKMPFFDDGTSKACRYKQNQQATYVNVRDDVAYNLCRGNKFSDDDICVHNQGILGGTDGKPTQDDSSLYALFNLTDLPAGYEEGFVRNLLFTGSDRVNYGYFFMKASHLGGHHVGLKITQGANFSIGSMTVLKMPLSVLTQTTLMSQWKSADVSQWITQLQASWKQDHDQYVSFAKTISNPAGSYGWDCPMRRRLFYSGMSPVFKPSLPSARRSMRLFQQQMTGEYGYAHPTQKRMNASAHIGPYITSNGFCYCPVTEDVPDHVCSISYLEDHNCSLRNTIRSVMGSKWMWSHTFLPKTKSNEYKQCAMQFDWPFVKGVLRDDGVLHSDDLDQKIWEQGSDVELKRCHLLDRLPDFQYAYIPVKELKQSYFTTLDRGVCHTGRLQKILTNVDSRSRRCVRSFKGYFENRITCQDGVLSEFENVFQVNRRRSKTPQEAYLNMYQTKRQRCNQCSPVPRFETRGGVPIQAESSIGIPFRRSASLVMAQDLKEALCKNDSVCLGLLNTSAWSKDNFMTVLLQHPEWLFKNISNKRPVIRPTQPSTESLWNQSWVYCPTPQALATGKKCQGSMTREEWLENRVHSCYATTRQIMQGQADPMARTSLCDVSGPLTNLCNAIEQAKKIIQGANCVRAGDPRCARQEYLYTPAAWDVSNNEFVHQTVQEFYQRVNSSVCPVEYNLTVLIQENGKTLLQCPAMPLYAAYELVNSLRNLVLVICDALIQLTGVLANLFMTLLGGEGNSEFYKDQFIATWQEFRRVFESIVGSVSDIFMDTVMFNGVVGVWVQKMMQGACEQINDILHYLHNVYCKLIVTYIPAFFESLKNVGQYIDSGFTVLNDFMETILKNYVPEAMIGMVARGYHAGYQSRMASQKQAAYDAADKVQLDAKKPVQASTMSAAERNTAMGKSSKAGLTNLAEESFDDIAKKDRNNKLVQALGAAGAGLDVGAQAYLFAKDAQTVAKIAEALKNAPDFWTIFDFTRFQKVLESFGEFLFDDVFCFNYINTNDSYSFLPCSWLRLPTPSVEMVGAVMPYATRCWAEAQEQDIGTTNLYACSGTSICCVDVYCSKKVLCVQCPFSQDPVLFSTYGCNTMTKQCQCGTPKMQWSKCLTHKDCQVTGSVCSLVTSIDDISYGVIPCSDCTVQSVCLITSSTQVGQCTCLANAKSSMALCQSEFGQSVLPGRGSLCGYETGSGQALREQYYWNDIALITCVNLRAPTCVQILTDTSTTFSMVMSNQIQSVTLNQASRRLLVDIDATSGLNFDLLTWPDVNSYHDPVEFMSRDLIHYVLQEEGWNHTGTRCATVVYEYNQRRKQDIPADLEFAAFQCGYWRSVGRKLIKDYNLTVLADMDYFLLSSNDLSYAISQPKVWESVLQNPLVIMDACFYHPWMKPVRAILRHYGSVDARRYVQPLKTDLKKNDIAESDERFPLKRGRKLLNYIEDTNKRIDQSPLMTKLNPAIAVSQLLSVDMTRLSQLWVVSDNMWPLPQWTGTCPPVYVTYAAGKEVVHTWFQYYSHFEEGLVERNLSNHLLAAFPNMRLELPSYESNNQSHGKTWTTLVFYTVLDTLKINMQDVANVIQVPCVLTDENGVCSNDNKLTLQNVVNTMLYCELDSVMFCSKQQYNLIPAAFFIVVMYVVLYVITNPLGIGFIATWYFRFIVVLIMYHAYNIAPGCVPMLPTCFLDQWIEAVQYLFPLSVQFPPILQCGDRCLRSCREFGFVSMQDPFLFFTCDLGVCDFFGNYLDVHPMKMLVGTNSSSDLMGYRICALATSVMSVPIALIIIGIIFFLLSCTVLLLSILPNILGVLWQIIVFNHHTME